MLVEPCKVPLGRGVAALLALCVSAVVGCKDDPAPPSQPSAKKEARVRTMAVRRGGQGGSALPAAGRVKPPTKLPVWRVPVGPRLGILPGKGLGPIRFGAHVETIERLMEAPCEERKQLQPGLEVCRYSAQAVEFFVRDRALERIVIHGQGRVFQAEPRVEYGIFNGAFESGVRMGMLVRGVQELMGPPQQTRPPGEGNSPTAVRVAEYPGVTLEFDESASGNPVLAGVILEPESPTD